MNIRDYDDHTSNIICKVVRAPVERICTTMVVTRGWHSTVHMVEAISNRAIWRNIKQATAEEL